MGKKMKSCRKKRTLMGIRPRHCIAVGLGKGTGR